MIRKRIIEEEKKKERNISKKEIWYIFILLCSTAFLVYERFKINRVDDASLVSVVFVVWVFLLLLPLFSEFELFGVRVKKEGKKAVEKSNEEVKEEIGKLQSMIISQMAVSTNVNNYLSQTNNELPDIYTEYSEVSAKIGEEDKRNIQESVVDLFKTRFCIEKYLKEILKAIGYDGFRMTPIQMVDFLYRREIVQSYDLYEKLINVIKITNRNTWY